jgi:cytochrome oxidase Cu insertion factor (SCO1/SenC/PrrC family)
VNFLQLILPVSTDGANVANTAQAAATAVAAAAAAVTQQSADIAALVAGLTAYGQPVPVVSADGTSVTLYSVSNGQLVTVTLPTAGNIPVPSAPAQAA